MKIQNARLLVALALLSILTAFVLMSGGEPASAKRGNAGKRKIAPPQSQPYGKSYGEWQVAQWQWLFSMPVDQHPLFDTADCGTGQSGKVWFLGGTYAVSGNATRDCTVPVGTALFFPILDVECATAEGNGTTFEELSACAEWVMDHAKDVAAEIDGVPVKNMEKYRGQSPLFTWGPLPENNVQQYVGWDFPAGTTSEAVSDGYFLMVRPLSEGDHTVHFAGALEFTQEEDGFDYFFSVDITYNLYVKP